MIKRSIKILSILLLSNIFCDAQYSLAKKTTFFNEQWLKAVVSVEKFDQNGKIRPIGTAFFISTEGHHSLLVSNKHVVTQDGNQAKIKKGLAYRLNLKNGRSKLIEDSVLVKRGAGTWFLSKSADLAVRFMYYFHESDIQWIPENMFLNDEDVQPGTPSLILGFPLGLRSEEYATPIVRRSMVALKAKDYYLVDGFVFPGNSGGPVIYMPAFQIGGIGIGDYLKKQRLVGVVSSYVPYKDTAISLQTKRPRIVFEENSGLCVVIPSSEIIKLIHRDDVEESDKAFK